MLAYFCPSAQVLIHVERGAPAGRVSPGTAAINTVCGQAWFRAAKAWFRQHSS